MNGTKSVKMFPLVCFRCHTCKWALWINAWPCKNNNSASSCESRYYYHWRGLRLQSGAASSRSRSFQNVDSRESVSDEGWSSGCMFTALGATSHCSAMERWKVWGHWFIPAFSSIVNAVVQKWSWTLLWNQCECRGVSPDVLHKCENCLVLNENHFQLLTVERQASVTNSVEKLLKLAVFKILHDKT